MSEEKNKGGRPRMWDDPDAMLEAGAAWIDARRSNDLPITISGLVLELGFADRRSFYDYELDARFAHTIKSLRSAIERAYEERLWTNAPTGAIFALKNLGWSDKQEIAHTTPDGPISVTYTIVDPRAGD